MQITLVLASIVLTFLVWNYSGRWRTRNLALLSILAGSILFLAACSPGPVQIIEQIDIIMSGLIPIVAAAASVLLPQEAAAIEAGATLVQGGLKALGDLVAQYNAAPTDSAFQQVTAAFSDIQKNLKELEDAAQVKDAATRTKINAVVQGASQSLALLEASLTAKSQQKILTASAATN